MHDVAVIIPCYNEEITIASVIEDFRRELPEAQIYVINNNCSDRTPEIAKSMGATVIPCTRKGKGAAIRKAFHQIEATLYVMVDGDNTYPAESVHEMIDATKDGADMVVGDRISLGHYRQENKRPLHNFGNSLVCKSINLLFNTNLRDIMSGYRVMTHNFVKHCPILVDGFAIETEMSIHAVEKLFEIKEIPIHYRDRPPGSFSKLNTFKDGINVIRAIAWVFKDSKPLIFFGAIATIPATALLLTLLLLGPSSLAALFLITTLIIMGWGFTLDTQAKYHRESFEVNMLKTPRKKQNQ